MNAVSFFQQFSSLFNNPEQEAVDAYSSNSKYTNYIMRKIQQIIENEGLKAEREYYRIDLIGWSDKNNEIKEIPDFNKHLWNLEIAVEHENASKDWMDEVVKLSYIVCPLKVVIGYNKNAEGDQRLLDYVADGLKILPSFDNIKKDEFMIILGNTSQGGSRNYFQYRGYLFDKSTEKFVRLAADS